MDLTSILAIIAALAGLTTGLVALIKAKNDNKNTVKRLDLDRQQAQIDNLVRIIDQLQGENKRLREALLQQQVQINDLRTLDRESQRQLDILRHELTKAQQHIAELVQRIAELVRENEKLQEQVNGKRDA